MNQSFGARPARPVCSRWIVANHKRGGGVSVSVGGNTCRPMDTMTIEPLRQSLRRCSRKLHRISFTGGHRGTRG